MEKYKSVKSYLESQATSKEDMKELILRSALNLLASCSRNFDGEAEMTEKTALPLHFLNDILDDVE